MSFNSNGNPMSDLSGYSSDFKDKHVRANQIYMRNLLLGYIVAKTRNFKEQAQKMG